MKINKIGNEKLVLIVIYLILVLFIIIPFLENNLYAGDGSGHLAAAEFLKENCFPKIVCWNQNYFLGYPQGQFYPQGMFWISSLISIILGISVASSMKFLIIISILLLPLTTYYFLNQFMDKEKSAIILIPVISIYIISDAWIGGNLQGLIKGGLFTNAFALPFFFLYLETFYKYVKKKDNLVLPTILLSSIILLHITVALASIISSLAIIIFEIYNKKIEKKDVMLLLPLIFAFLITSFWTIPFMAKMEYTSIEKLGGDYFLKPEYILLINLFFLFILKGKEKILPLMATAIITISIILDITHISFHTYRLNLFWYILTIISIFVFLLKQNKKIKILAGILIFFLLIESATTIIQLPMDGVYDQKITGLEMLENSRYHFDLPYWTQTSSHFHQTIVSQRNDVKITKGLFIEGSKNAKYLMALEKFNDPTNIIWGKIPSEEQFQAISLNENFSSFAYELFGVSRVINTTRQNAHINLLTTHWNYYKKNNYPEFRSLIYQETKLNNTIIETLDYVPEKLDKSVDEWFYTITPEKYKTLKKIENTKELNFNEIKIENISINHNKINFYLEERSPVLIKISYYPNWKAYGGENEIEIYEATPSYMFLIGEGKIRLEYKYLWYEKILILISIISLIFLLAIGSRNSAKVFFKSNPIRNLSRKIL